MSSGGEIYRPDFDFAKLAEQELKAELFEVRCVIRRGKGEFRDMAKATRAAILAELDKRKAASGN